MSPAPKSATETSDDDLEHLRSVLDSTPLLVHSADLQGNIISANDHWLQRMGYSLSEVVGTPSVTYLSDESRRRAHELRGELLREGTVTDIEAQVVSRGGERIDVIICSKVLADEAGRPDRVITTLLDITERKRAEETLRLRESYLTAIIENLPGLVWLKDAEGRFLAVNRAFARSSGAEEPEELVGRKDHDIWPPELAEKYRSDDAAVMATGVPVQVEEPIVDEGRRRWFETFKTPVRGRDGKIIGTTGYARDVTTRKLEEEALRNIQKLESLGVLAGGIAHDFNNLLAGIFGCVDLALQVTTQPEVVEILSTAHGAIDRSRGLTQQLLTFAKGGVPVKKVDRLDPFIQDAARFALSGSRASCKFHIPKDLWHCDFDRNQIGQVIDNIVINAQQAMPEGGAIEIEADNVTVTDEEGRAQPPPGDYVRISITDHGRGIPPEIVPRIFDPFFSTKAEGHGLGLATSYSIVSRHGGAIEVDSTVGRGSTFRIFLPAVPGATVGRLREAPPDRASFGKVILMDDDDLVRFTVGQVLESLGYTVIATASGEEAVATLANELGAGRRIDAMILDLTVPGGMGGLEAIGEIRRLAPQLPVFVASGYAEDSAMASPTAHGFTDSIRKPFSRAELHDLLRRNG